MSAKLAGRLRMRLRRLLESSGDGAGERRRAVSLTAELAGKPGRDAQREGRLLVWRESLGDGSWPRGEGALLLGPEGAPSAALRISEDAGVDASQLAFVDIETCGLADLPVFLVGVLMLDDSGDGGWGWSIVQYLAPDASAEPEMLSRTAELLARKRDWVSFNGRSFDIPRMRTRCRRHGVEWPECRSHQDLLHAVRRRFRGELPNCRLKTVESLLLGLERLPGDVPGREVPSRYYDYVRTGERRWLDPVIEHNRRDVAALGALFLRLTRDAGGDPGERREVSVREGAVGDSVDS